jgi:hypothetical protein
MNITAVGDTSTENIEVCNGNITPFSTTCAKFYYFFMPVVLKSWRSPHINGAVSNWAEGWALRAQRSALIPNPRYMPFQTVNTKSNQLLIVGRSAHRSKTHRSSRRLPRDYGVSVLATGGESSTFLATTP